MKKLLPVITAILILVLVAPVACAKAPESAPAFAPPPMPAPAPAPRISLEKGDSSGSALPTVNEERMIVRNGDISLVVKDVLEARDAIARLAVSLDGYVVSSSIAGEEEGMRGNIAIRVPDNKFEEALSEFRNLAVRVRSESTGSRDVTEEYVDLKSRLKNAEATESQYLEVLEKATDVEDILRVYERLSQVRREIEQLKGQMQYLERTSSMSLISVGLMPEVSAKPVISAGWSALEILKSAVRGIVTFGQWLVTILIWLLIFSPVWGAVAGLTYWRRRKKRAAS